MLVITANTLRQQLTNTEGKDWGFDSTVILNFQGRFLSFKNKKANMDNLSNSLPIFMIISPLLLISPDGCCCLIPDISFCCYITRMIDLALTVHQYIIATVAL